MGKADHAHKNPRPVIDPEFPDREELRRVLADVDRHRARVAAAPRSRYRQEGDDLPFRQFHPHALDDMVTSKNAWARLLIGSGGLIGFMAGHGTFNPFDIWATTDAAGVGRILDWLHNAALIVVLACLTTVVIQLAWAVHKERQGPYVGRDEQLFWAGEGHYITADDLDVPARNLLARTQKAIRTVTRSEVNKADLLDRTHNELRLPSAEWELAKMLRYASNLRAEHPGIERAEEPLDAAGAAYGQAQKVIGDQVAALERYAEKALAADIAYQISGGDQHALDDLETLTHQADATHATFRRSLDQAVEAAKALDR